MSAQVVEKLVKTPKVVESGERIPDGYLTREQVMQRLEISETGVERRTRTGEIESKLFPCPGRRHIRYYREESVERLKALTERKRAERPPSAQRPFPRALGAGPAELALALPDKSVALLNQLIEIWKAPPAAKILVTEKLWLTLDEAVEYSGLARGDLLKLCQTSRERDDGAPLLVRKSGGWKISRRSLERFSQ